MSSMNSTVSTLVVLPGITLLLAIGINKTAGIGMHRALGVAAVCVAAWWMVAPCAEGVRRLRRWIRSLR